MYRHNTITFSARLRRAFQTGVSRETAFGVRDAINFARHILMFPHVIADDFTLYLSDSTASTFFHQHLQQGRTVRNMLMEANRVVTLVDILRIEGDRPVDQIMLSISGYRSDSSTRWQALEALFDHRFGFMSHLSWHVRGRTLAIRDFKVCQYCHAYLGGANGLEGHRHGCRGFMATHATETMNYEQGCEDGYRNRPQQPGSESYNLGFDIGGVTYQADLALGRITPSM